LLLKHQLVDNTGNCAVEMRISIESTFIRDSKLSELAATSTKDSLSEHGSREGSGVNISAIRCLKRKEKLRRAACEQCDGVRHVQRRP